MWWRTTFQVCLGGGFSWKNPRRHTFVQNTFCTNNNSKQEAVPWDQTLDTCPHTINPPRKNRSSVFSLTKGFQSGNVSVLLCVKPPYFPLFPIPNKKTHTHKHTHMRTHTDVHLHITTYAHTTTHKYTYTQIHTHTHMHKQTHTHTQTPDFQVPNTNQFCIILGPKYLTYKRIWKYLQWLGVLYTTFLTPPGSLTKDQKQHDDDCLLGKAGQQSGGSFSQILFLTVQTKEMLD